MLMARTPTSARVTISRIANATMKKIADATITSSSENARTATEQALAIVKFCPVFMSLVQTELCRIRFDVGQTRRDFQPDLPTLAAFWMA